MKQLSLFGETNAKPQKLASQSQTICSIMNALANREPPHPDSPICVSYGGGTNSTALLVWMVFKNIKPDAIIFADTGGEKPETYAFIDLFSNWLTEKGFPPVTVVCYEMVKPRPRKRFLCHYDAKKWKSFSLSSIAAQAVAIANIRQSVRYQTLAEECIVLEALPGKAYGNGECSMKWKVNVVRNFCKQTFPKKQIRQWVGIHAGEKRRLLLANGHPKSLVEDGLYYNEYPLILNNIDQVDCNALIIGAGLPLPPKSSCWFCPNMKPAEVLELKEKHPELYDYGCHIEEEGMKYINRSTSIKGLGRSFSWRGIGKLSPLEQAILDQQKSAQKCQCLD